LLLGNEFTLNFSTYLQCSNEPHLYSDKVLSDLQMIFTQQLSSILDCCSWLMHQVASVNFIVFNQC